MSNAKDPFGPAFPIPTTNEHGMTLRDWFAGQAISELTYRSLSYNAVAAEAYKIADAMLAERMK